MLRKTARNIFKDVLSFTKVKLLHNRITLSRYTTVFFWAALINFIVGVVFQSISLSDHIMGDQVTTALLSKANLNDSVGLPLLVKDDQILICTGIPGMSGTTCDYILPLGNTENRTDIVVRNEVFERDLMDFTNRGQSLCPNLVKRIEEMEPIRNELGEVTGVRRAGLLVSLPCITSFVWLAEMLRDAKREDFVALTFQIWLLVFALITILNESLPHLFTVLIGHVLLTGWAAFRIHESFRLSAIYYDGIVDGPCQGFDPMGTWWTDRFNHSIPIVASNSVSLLIMAGLTYKLVRLYATQTFSRVGASTEVHRLYKIVLTLSVSEQLTGFFALASTGIWIDKISHGPLHQFVTRFPLYLAGFLILAILVIPWLVLGWTTIRREGRRSFLVFIGLSAIMLAISIAMFASPIYRFVFDRWAFFATLTVTSFVLICATVALGAWCRMGYGKGLKEYLNVTDALEGEDFTPVVFSVNGEKVTFVPEPERNDEKKVFDLTFDVERRASFVRRPSMSKSSLLLPKPSVAMVPTPVQAPERPPSTIFRQGSTRIMSPTPPLVRETRSGNLNDLIHVDSRTAGRTSNGFVTQIGVLQRTPSNASTDSSSGSVIFASPTASPAQPRPVIKRPTPALQKIASSSHLPSSPAKRGLRVETNVGLPSRPAAHSRLSSRTPSPESSSSDHKPGFF